MKVLYVSYDGMTDTLGQSQVIPYLKGLSGLGHEIHLLSFEKTHKFIREEALISQILRESNIRWYPQKYTQNPPVLSTVRDVQVMKRMVKQIIIDHSIEILHCRSYISALAGLWAKRQFSVKFVFDMRGFWADERVEGGLWSRKNPLFVQVYRYFKRREKKFLLNADRIISLTEEAHQIIDSWFETKLPITVIPCCADLDHFSDDKVTYNQKRDAKQQLGIADDAFILTYLGSLGTWYLLDEMLDFFKQLKQKKPDAIFLFITADNSSLIYRRLGERGIDQKSIVVRSVQRAEVPLFISLSSASIFFIKPSFSKKASSPTKMGELMAMGIPLICNAGVGDVSFIMQTSNAGFVVPECVPVEYQKVIDRIDELVVLDKPHIKKMAHHHFSLETGIALYDEVYKIV